MSNPKWGKVMSEMDSTVGNAPSGDASSNEGQDRGASASHGQGNGDGERSETAKWQSLSRQNESRYKKAAVELEKAQQALADRDVKIGDLSASAAAEVAAAKLEVALARVGMGEEQASNFAKFIDTKRLLKDGRPDADAIREIAAAIPASLRTGPPDPDQGRSSNSRPTDMNSLIRRHMGIQA